MAASNSLQAGSTSPSHRVTELNSGKSVPAKKLANSTRFPRRRVYWRAARFRYANYSRTRHFPVLRCSMRFVDRTDHLDCVGDPCVHGLDLIHWDDNVLQSSNSKFPRHPISEYDGLVKPSALKGTHSVSKDALDCCVGGAAAIVTERLSSEPALERTTS